LSHLSWIAGPAPEILLARARGGDAAALGHLLELYRNDLRLVARSLLGRVLRLRLDPSDLVQETFLDAHRDFAQFTGAGEPELLAWLRRILARNLADQARRHRAPGRDPRREESLEALIERPGDDAHELLAGRLPSPSPSAQASRRERAVLLADALADLPADYRDVILLRNFEHLPFDQVAARMGRSPGAVRMLWARALERPNSPLRAQSSPRAWCSLPARAVIMSRITSRSSQRGGIPASP
jgi:RNA polymerase sigma-70 factor (ECF subfamily)